MVRFNSAGRVQAIEGMFLAHPGTCLLCGKVPSDPGEYFANLGVELEFFGVAYLCQACCSEIADFVGFIDPRRFEETNAVNETLALKVIELQKSLEAAKEMLNVRIDTAGRGELIFNEPLGLSVFEVEHDSDFIDSVLDGDKSESA